MESNGNLMNYVFKKAKDHIFEMEPKEEENQKSQVTNYRENPLNNKLHIDRKNKCAILYLADGGKRRYKMTKPLAGKVGQFFGWKKGVGSEYLLEEEISSSGHVTKYTYQDNGKTLIVANAFSRVILHQTSDYPNFKIITRGSDEKKLFYLGKAINKRCHLMTMGGEGLSCSNYSYVEDPKTKKLWADNIYMSNGNLLNVTYSFPEVKKALFADGYRVNLTRNYKVKSLKNNGEKLCDYIYFNDYTIVRDCNRVETKYIHSNGGLDKIVYADNSQEKFVWENGNLVEKSLYNSDGALVFSKFFVFDA